MAIISVSTSDLLSVCGSADMSGRALASTARSCFPSLIEAKRSPLLAVAYTCFVADAAGGVMPELQERDRKRAPAGGEDGGNAATGGGGGGTENATCDTVFSYTTGGEIVVGDGEGIYVLLTSGMEGIDGVAFVA